MNCPGCKQEMAEQSFEGLGGKRVVLDLCQGCHGLWFDANESRQLSALGTLHLFRELHGRRGEPRNRAARVCKCPRCDSQLALAYDMAHNNRFQYSRCPQKHGHFIRFFQFLREKGIVRGLNLKELTELRKHVDTLQCSDCGSPIDLAKHSGCASCHAPISILDPRCVEETVKDAQEETGSRHNVAPEVAARLLMNNLRMEGFHRKPDVRVAAAAAAIGAIPLVSQQQTHGRAGEAAAHVAEVAVDVAEIAVDIAELDLIDVGVGIVSSALESLGDLFSF
ncbi:MAG TPA: zf-TFIIB domain-containing protein [Archangium sp.]|nr:zf-TFIIB domain-containing protein [Archangium sp.]